MIFSFEDCVLDTERRELRRGGIVQPVEPQVFDLLACLLANRPRVVMRDELFNEVWNGRFVSDAALSTRLHAARRAIGDDGKTQRLIRTVHAHGLSFVGEVREIGAGLPHPATGRRFEASPVLMVAPLVHAPGDLRQALLAEAFHEELVAKLAGVSWIALVPRPAPGLRYLVDGSVRESSGTLRAIVRLVDAANGGPRWVGRYAERSGDPFELQQRIAAQAASALVPQLYALEAIRVAASRDRLSTWDAIIRGLSLMNVREKRHVAAARTLVGNASRADPHSSVARSLLSFLTTLGVHMGWERRKTTIPGAIETARQATLLDPRDAWAHLALGYASMYRHPDEAMPHLERAIALDPMLSLGHYFRALAATYSGHCASVFAYADTSARSAPFDLLAQGNSGVCDNVRSTASFVMGNFADGVAFARRALAENPNLVPARRSLIINLSLGGEVSEARRAVHELKRLVPGISQQILAETNGGVWANREDGRKYAEAFAVAGLE